MRIKLATMTMIGLLALAGCKKKEESKPAETPPPSPSSGTAPATAQPTPPTPPAPSAAPVDTCGFVAKDQIEATVGKVMGEPSKDAPTGSFLGGCTWVTEQGAASISARPAGEFDGTARDGTEVAGIGEKTVSTKSGLLVKLAGKPYFLQVMVMGSGGIDAAKSQALARLAADGAK